MQLFDIRKYILYWSVDAMIYYFDSIERKSMNAYQEKSKPVYDNGGLFSLYAFK
jgi:hypothetical protein